MGRISEETDVDSAGLRESLTLCSPEQEEIGGGCSGGCRGVCDHGQNDDRHH
jgi:hypothetical protein